MSSRSADASIRGYTYQFLHTILDILNQEDSAIHTIEGIEDLDIYNADIAQLCQYKYHKGETFTNSLVGKPIGLMYNHFLNNELKQYNYKLIVYVPGDIPLFDEQRLTQILKLDSAQKRMEEENRADCSNPDKIRKFFKKFSCIQALEFSELENMVVDKLVQVFNVSEEEAKVNFLPNALKHINYMGTRSTIKEREISTKEFKQLLSNNKEISDIAFYTRVKGESEAVKLLKNRMRSIGIKHNSFEHVFFLYNDGRNQIPDLMLEVAKKFYYDGNKFDYMPATFIVKNIAGIKKSILKIMKETHQLVLFNDGYEDHEFMVEVFNQDKISTSGPRNGKVNQVNFNFRLISLETYRLNKEDIRFTNPVVFCIDEPEGEDIATFNKIFYINSLSNESIISVIGG